MPDSDPSTEVLTVGQRVVVLGKRKGTVRFVGSTAFGPGCNPVFPCRALSSSLPAKPGTLAKIPFPPKKRGIRSSPVHGMFAWHSARGTQVCPPARLPR